jgi:hypothetical protein
VINRLSDVGVEGVGMPPAQFEVFWHQQLDYYGKIVSQQHHGR